mgnify:CR=1 FL=1
MINIDTYVSHNKKISLLSDYIIEKLHLNKNISTPEKEGEYDCLYAVFKTSDGVVHHLITKKYLTPAKFERYIHKKFQYDSEISKLEIFTDPEAAKKYKLSIDK